MENKKTCKLEIQVACEKKSEIRRGNMENVK